jgi:hypothetical protein
LTPSTVFRIGIHLVSGSVGYTLASRQFGAEEIILMAGPFHNKKSSLASAEEMK